jgi:hypothetical protein
VLAANFPFFGLQPEAYICRANGFSLTKGSLKI